MVRVSRTYDPVLVDEMIHLPYIWKEITDDSCPKYPQNLNLVYIIQFCVVIMVDFGVGPEGVFVFVPKSDTSCEAHTMLKDTCRGAKAVEAGRQAIQFIFDKTKFTEITSFTFSDRPQISWYMRVLGLKKTSEKEWPSTRDGKNVTVLNYAIQKSK